MKSRSQADTVLYVASYSLTNNKTREDHNCKSIPHEDKLRLTQQVLPQMKQQQHHQSLMLQRQYYLQKHDAVIGRNTRQSIQYGLYKFSSHNHPDTFLCGRTFVESNTSLSQVSFHRLICRELNGNMSDTSQGRDESTF